MIFSSNDNFIFGSLFFYRSFYLKGRVTQKKNDTHIPWLSARWLGLGQTEARGFLSLNMGAAWIQGHLPLLSQEHWQEGGSEVEQLGLELVLQSAMLVPQAAA